MSGNLVIKPLKATLTRDVDFFSKMVFIRYFLIIKK